MAVHKKYPALGRGLDVLMRTDEVHTGGSSSINEVAIKAIKANPNQPRREFDETALRELADSIREIGIIQPITVRDMGDGTFVIIAGERRWRASQMAGLVTIPAYIRTVDDENMMEMALVENIQRENLNSMEIALAYQHLMEQYNLTQERLSERVGKNRTTINTDGTEEPHHRHGPRPCPALARRPHPATEGLQRTAEFSHERAPGGGDGEGTVAGRHREGRRQAVEGQGQFAVGRV